MQHEVLFIMAHTGKYHFKMQQRKRQISKSSLHYTRGIMSKPVINDGVHLRR